MHRQRLVAVGQYGRHDQEERGTIAREGGEPPHLGKQSVAVFFFFFSFEAENSFVLYRGATPQEKKRVKGRRHVASRLVVETFQDIVNNNATAVLK